MTICSLKAYLRKSRSKGFTLVEMLVVVGVIIILVSIVVPNFLNALQQAKRVQAKSQIVSYKAAIQEYFTDTRQHIPSGSEHVYYILSGLAPFNKKASKRYNPPYRDFNANEIGRGPGQGTDWDGYDQNPISTKFLGEVDANPVPRSNFQPIQPFGASGVRWRPIIDPWGRPVVYISADDLRLRFNRQPTPWSEFIAISDETAFNDSGQAVNVPYDVNIGQFWSAGRDGVTAVGNETLFGFVQPGNLLFDDGRDNDLDSALDVADLKEKHRTGSGRETTFNEDDISSW